VLDSNVVLKAGEGRDHEFRIESDLILSSDAGELVVHFAPYEHEPKPATHLNELAEIVNCRLSHACVYTDGVLRLVLEHEGGRMHVLTVEPDPRYEAWMYTHKNYILACRAGGRLPGWQPET
jgi:hypothetical protein